MFLPRTEASDTRGARSINRFRPCCKFQLWKRNLPEPWWMRGAKDMQRSSAGDGKRSRPAVNVVRAKRFGLRTSSDSIVVCQSRGVGSQPRSRLASGTALLCMSFILFILFCPFILFVLSSPPGRGFEFHTNNVLRLEFRCGFDGYVREWDRSGAAMPYAGSGAALHCLYNQILGVWIPGDSSYRRDLGCLDSSGFLGVWIPWRPRKPGLQQTFNSLAGKSTSGTVAAGSWPRPVVL
jgi:hypothetical protein